MVLASAEHKFVDVEPAESTTAESTTDVSEDLDSTNLIGLSDAGAFSGQHCHVTQPSVEDQELTNSKWLFSFETPVSEGLLSTPAPVQRASPAYGSPQASPWAVAAHWLCSDLAPEQHLGPVLLEAFRSTFSSVSSGDASTRPLPVPERSSEEALDAPTEQWLHAECIAQLRFQFCPDKPQNFHEAVDAEIDQAFVALSAPKWSAVSPMMTSSEGCVGSSIKNTFVHVAPPPATLLGGSAWHRAKSEPRDMGSARLVWQVMCSSLTRPRMNQQCRDQVESKGCSLDDEILRLLRGQHEQHSAANHEFSSEEKDECKVTNSTSKCVLARKAWRKSVHQHREESEKDEAAIPSANVSIESWDGKSACKSWATRWTSHSRSPTVKSGMCNRGEWNCSQWHASQDHGKWHGSRYGGRQNEIFHSSAADSGPWSWRREAKAPAWWKKESSSGRCWVSAWPEKQRYAAPKSGKWALHDKW